MGKRWQAMRTFVKDQLTTPMGDFDPARVWGYSIIGFGGMIFNALEIYAVVVQKAAFDPNAYADGLIKVGAALVAAATGVWIKSGRHVEVPLPETTVVATASTEPAPDGASDPNLGAQAAEQAAAAVTAMGTLANTEITQARGVFNNLTGFWTHIKAYFKR